MTNIFTTITSVLAPTGAKIYVPEYIAQSGVLAVPSISVYKVAGKAGEFLLNGTRICNVGRFQLTMRAVTVAGLENLISLVEDEMDMNTTDFILSFPLGVGATGSATNPKCLFQTNDWLIQY
jgi:hypothetical protein